MAKILETPLTDEEKAFASDMDNYNQFFRYMKVRKLNEEEWYDILIMHYLRAVRKYLTIPKLQEYEFTAVLFRTLDNGMSNHYRAMNTQKRMPEGGFVYLDYTMENDHMFSESTIPEWWIDRKTSVERQVINKECFEEFWKAIDGFFWNEQMKVVASLLLNGYTKREIIRYMRIRFNDAQWGNNVHDWNFTINQLRTAFKETYGF